MFRTFGLHHIKSSGFAAAGKSIHQDCQIPFVHECERKIVRANAEIHDAHAVRQLRPSKTSDHLDSKCVVTQKNVSDSSHENSIAHNDAFSWFGSNGFGSNGSISSGEKKKRGPVWRSIPGRARDRPPARLPDGCDYRNHARWLR